MKALIAAGLCLWAALLIAAWFAFTDEPERSTTHVEEASEDSAYQPPASTTSTTPSPSPAGERQEATGMGTHAGSDLDWLRQLVADAFPDDVATAFRIVECESAWDPNARSATNDSGLFQINDVHTLPGGVAYGVNLFDPAENVAAARRLWEQQGWHPWACY